MKFRYTSLPVNYPTILKFPVSVSTCLPSKGNKLDNTFDGNCSLNSLN